MDSSAHIKKLREIDNLLQSLKDLEKMETGLQKAIEKTLQSDAEFRLKFMIKGEKKKEAVNPFPDDFMEELRMSGAISLPSTPKDDGYREVVDIVFEDQFVTEFLLYWYNRTKKAKENLLTQSIKKT